jgi:hypothetical protein
MAESLKRGDKVKWNTSTGRTRGLVEKKLTGTMHVKGHTCHPFFRPAP